MQQGGFPGGGGQQQMGALPGGMGGGGGGGGGGFGPMGAGQAGAGGGGGGGGGVMAFTDHELKQAYCNSVQALKDYITSSNLLSYNILGEFGGFEGLPCGAPDNQRARSAVPRGTPAREPAAAASWRLRVAALRARVCCELWPPAGFPARLWTLVGACCVFAPTI